jgi:hypothetical protein
MSEEIDDLRAEVERLRAENAALRRDYEILRDDVANPEIYRLEQENAALREAWAVVEAVSNAPPYYSDQPLGWYCTMCDGWETYQFGQNPDKFEHDADCPVTRARKLLAE